MLTPNGFVAAKDIKIGNYLAAAIKVPYFGKNVIDDNEIIGLAHFIAEGTRVNGSITTTSPEVIDDIYNVANYFKLSMLEKKE